MRPLLLTALLLLASILSAGQSKSGIAKLSNDRVIIRRQTTVLVRHGKLAKEFPERKRAVIDFPVVTGLSDPTVLQRVRSILQIKKIFNSTLAEYRQFSWLDKFTYRVGYNRNYILDISFTQSGVGAYPDSQTKHLLIDLKKGAVIKTSDAFISDKLRSLASLVDQKLQKEIKKTLEFNERTGNASVEEMQSIRGSSQHLKFGLENLSEFSVSRNGITFLYDAGFPHAIKALEPGGHYFFTYAELATYIKRDGPLGQFVS